MKIYKHLTQEQRYTIAVCLKEKKTLSAIAKLIGVSKSTVSRGIKRNSNMNNHYVAIDAQQFSERRKSVPRRPKKLSREDWQDIEQRLRRHWSPETIVGIRKKRGKTLCVGWMDVPHYQESQGARGEAVHIPATPSQAPQAVCPVSLSRTVWAPMSGLPWWTPDHVSGTGEWTPSSAGTARARCSAATATATKAASEIATPKTGWSAKEKWRKKGAAAVWSMLLKKEITVP